MSSSGPIGSGLALRGPALVGSTLGAVSLEPIGSGLVSKVPRLVGSTLGLVGSALVPIVSAERGAAVVDADTTACSGAAVVTRKVKGDVVSLGPIGSALVLRGPGLSVVVGLAVVVNPWLH